jgi:hypothetical protein
VRLANFTESLEIVLKERIATRVGFLRADLSVAAAVSPRDYRRCNFPQEANLRSAKF